MNQIPTRLESDEEERQRLLEEAAKQRVVVDRRRAEAAAAQPRAVATTPPPPTTDQRVSRVLQTARTGESLGLPPSRAVPMAAAVEAKRAANPVTAGFDQDTRDLEHRLAVQRGINQGTVQPGGTRSTGVASVYGTPPVSVPANYRPPVTTPPANSRPLFAGPRTPPPGTDLIRRDGETDEAFTQRQTAADTAYSRHVDALQQSQQRYNASRQQRLDEENQLRRSAQEDARDARRQRLGLQPIERNTENGWRELLGQDGYRTPPRTEGRSTMAPPTMAPETPRQRFVRDAVKKNTPIPSHMLSVDNQPDHIDLDALVDGAMIDYGPSGGGIWRFDEGANDLTPVTWDAGKRKWVVDEERQRQMINN
jgi:hypothetical protein